jgi:thiamine pyrophosphokinase
MTPDLVIGDLDSIDARTLARLRRLGVPLETYPADKDATDSDLAVERARAWGATAITLVGALGGVRHDHGLANVLLLTRTELAGVRMTLLDNRHEVMLLRGGTTARWRATVGELVSLLPLGAAEGVTTTGLRWPLANAHLPAGSTRGVSNEAIEPGASVSVAAGCLLVTRTLPARHLDWAV